MPNVIFAFWYIRRIVDETYKRKSGAVKYAFSIVAQDAAELSRQLIEEAGCDGIYYCVQNAEKFRFTYEEYRELVTPSDLEVLKIANHYSTNNILHCCGWAGDQNRMEVWQDYPAKAVNWAIYVEKNGFKRRKRIFPWKMRDWRI